MRKFILSVIRSRSLNVKSCVSYPPFIHPPTVACPQGNNLQCFISPRCFSAFHPPGKLENMLLCLTLSQGSLNVSNTCYSSFSDRLPRSTFDRLVDCTNGLPQSSLASFAEVRQDWCFGRLHPPCWDQLR